MLKRFICILTMLVVVLSITLINTSANTTTLPSSDKIIEVKSLCTATINDDFSPNEIIVVLNNTESRKLKDYDVNHFTEVTATSVKNLSTYTTNQLKEQKINASTSKVTNSKLKEENYHQVFLITLNTNSKSSVLKCIKALEQRDDVLMASPNFYLSLDSLSLPSQSTTDEPYNASADLDATINDTLASQQWALNKIDLFSAWDLQTKNTTVRVGIIDTGINNNHIDLFGKVNTSLSVDFSDENNALYETAGHGTLCAGIIGAKVNNKKGIAGVCKNVDLVSLKVTHYDASEKKHVPSLSRICSAIDYAQANNISILNCSISGPDKYDLIKTKLENYDGLFVCSAGNKGTDIGTKDNYRYPAYYKTDNMICVANSTEDDLLEEDSCYSTTYVNLVAPGTNICSTYKDDYATFTGTSMATPYVTGVAALLKSEYPTMDTEALKDYIIKGVDIIPELSDKVKTGGRLNAYKTFTSVHGYKVLYNPGDGGGTQMKITKATYGCETKLRKNTYTNGYADFAGWYAHRAYDNKWRYTNGTKRNWFEEGEQPSGYYKYLYSDEQSLWRMSKKNDDTITMYAQWERTYTINFNSNNGTGSMPFMNISYNDTKQLRTNTFERNNNWEFDHWYANPEGPPPDFIISWDQVSVNHLRCLTNQMAIQELILQMVWLLTTVLLTMCITVMLLLCVRIGDRKQECWVMQTKMVILL